MAESAEERTRVQDLMSQIDLLGPAPEVPAAAPVQARTTPPPPVSAPDAPKPTAPDKEEKPFADVLSKKAKAAVSTVAAAVSPRDTPMEKLRKDKEVKARLRFQQETVKSYQQVAAQLKKHGGDKAVSLTRSPDGSAAFDVGAAMQEITTNYQQKYAQEMYDKDWNSLKPDTPEFRKVQEAAASKALEEMARAASLGRGAVFIDTDPDRTNRWAAEHIPMWFPGAKLAVSTLLPEASVRTTVAGVGAVRPTAAGSLSVPVIGPAVKARFDPYSPPASELETDSPSGFLLRAINAPINVLLSSTKSAAQGKAPHLLDPEGDVVKAIEAQTALREEKGGFKAVLMDPEARKESLAIGNKLVSDLWEKGDWDKAALTAMSDFSGVGGGDENDLRLVENLRDDKLATQAAIEQSEAVAQYTGVDPLVLKMIFTPIGIVADFGLDFTTLGFVAAGTGARLLGATEDLAAIRKVSASAAAGEIPDLRTALRLADDAKPGGAAMLEMNVAVKSRLPQKVVAQLDILQAKVLNAGQDAAAAQAKVAAAETTAEKAAASWEAAEVARRAAAARLEYATAELDVRKALAENWKTGKADEALRAAEHNFKIADESRIRAERLAKELQAHRETHKATYKAIDEGAGKVSEARVTYTEAKQTLADAKEALKVERTRLRELGVSLEYSKVSPGGLTEGATRARVAQKAELKEGIAGLKKKDHPLRAAVTEAKTATQGSKAALDDTVFRLKRTLKESPAVISKGKKLHQGMVRNAVAAGERKSLGHAWMLGVKPEAATGVQTLDEAMDAVRLTRQQHLDDLSAAVEARRAAKKAYGKAETATGKSRLAAKKSADRVAAEMESAANVGYRADLDKWRASSWREVFGEVAEDIEVGTKALATLPKKATKPGDLLAKSTAQTLDEGARVVDATALKRQLREQFTREGVQWVTERGGEAGAKLKEVLDKGGLVRLTADDVFDLQQLSDPLRIGAEATHPKAKAIATVRALEQVGRDPAILEAVARSVKGVSEQGARVSAVRWVKRKVTGLRAAFDPLAARIGETSEELAAVVRSMDQMMGTASDELAHVQRSAGHGFGLRGVASTKTREQALEDARLAVFRYIDDTEPMDIFGRKTFFNTGSDSLWAQFRRQILSDDRAKGMVGESTFRGIDGLTVEERASSAAEFAMATGAEFAKGVPPGGEKAALKAVEEVAKKAGVKAKKAVAENKLPPSLPLTGLSRMWLPSGQQLDPRKSQMLLNRTWALLKDPEITTYEAFAERLRAFTASEAAFGTADAAARAVPMGAMNVAHGVVQGRTNQLFSRAIGGMVTPKEAQQANMLLLGDPMGVTDWRSAVAVLNRMGAPFTQDAVRQGARGKQTAAVYRELIVVGQDGSGKAMFLEQNLARELDNIADRVVKEASRRYAKPRSFDQLTAGNAIAAPLSLWKQSVVTGLGVPNPRFWTNNIMGDFSQLWLGEGLGVAGRMSAQNLLTNLPWARTYLDVVGKEMSAVSGAHSLPSAVMSLVFDPLGAKVWNGMDGVLTTTKGHSLPYSRVREWMAEDVLDTFVNEEFMRASSKIAPDWMTKASNWQADINNFGNYVQQRQRGNLYMDLLRRGYSRSEARARTLDALYDWSHGLSEWEARYLTKVMPFYRFWKLAGKQVGLAAIEPLTKPTVAMERWMKGEGGLLRIKQQLLAKEYGTDFLLRPEWEEGMSEVERQKTEMARYLRPEWYTTRMGAALDPVTDQQRDYFKRARGKDYDYLYSAAPPATVVDIADMGMSMAFFLAGLGDLAAEKAGLDMPGGMTRAPDWELNFWKPLFNVSGPFVEETLGAGLEAVGVDVDARRYGDTTKLSRGEVAVLSTMGVPVFPDPDPDKPGVMRAATASVLILRNMPLFLQASPVLNAAYFENPGWEEGPGQGLAWGIGQWTNAWKRTPYSKDEALTYRQFKIAEAIERAKVASEQDVREAKTLK